MKHEATNAGCMCSHKAARYVARLTPSKRSHPFQCISKWNSTCRHRSQQCEAQPHQYHEQACWAHSAYPLLHEKEDEENGGCVRHARDPCDSTWTEVDYWLMTALGSRRGCVTRAQKSVREWQWQRRTAHIADQHAQEKREQSEGVAQGVARLLSVRVVARADYEQRQPQRERPEHHDGRLERH